MSKITIRLVFSPVCLPLKKRLYGTKEVLSHATVEADTCEADTTIENVK